jgi:DNA-binding transcriptional MerR regulator
VTFLSLHYYVILLKLCKLRKSSSPNKEDRVTTMTADELLIHELAARAGISVRTIRYYVNEGLLPPPSYQGKYSHYTPSYLDRLELIRRLKESYLPLREIRKIMNALTDDQVRNRLKELPLPSPKFSPEQKSAQSAAKPGTKALDYINSVMDTQTRYRMKGTVDQPQPRSNNKQDTFFEANISLPEQSPTINDEEIWQRISFAPGVELHLRRPMDPDTESRVQHLINFAKRMFHTK